ncbi:hypothetical protein PTKIN_Ptkin11bG0149900 [Pterospermum kingtungense]
MQCLVELHLDGSSIEELPSSIGYFSCLILLNLKDCKNLASLPNSINGLKSLKFLNLSGCSKIENLPENLQQVEFLEELDLSETAIRKHTPSFSNSNILKSYLSKDARDHHLIYKQILFLFSRSFWQKFYELPATITRLSKLRFLQLSDCERLKDLPDFQTNNTDGENQECSETELKIGFVNAKVKKCRGGIVYKNDWQVLELLNNSIPAANIEDISEDATTVDGSIVGNGSILKRKYNTVYEEKEKEKEEEAGSQPKQLQKFLKLIIGKKH